MNKLVSIAILTSATAFVAPRAEAACSLTGQVVTYYSEPDRAPTSTDPRRSADASGLVSFEERARYPS